ncbi:MAG: hypothetical protein GZ088_03765 [Acidipila sp.]|nr:hypothetical protein [Acidipila sp.]
MSDRNWRELYRAALIEVDAELLRERVAAAEAAINAHVESMKQRASSLDERLAISDAAEGLRVLKREPRYQPEPQENTPEISF